MATIALGIGPHSSTCYILCAGCRRRRETDDSMHCPVSSNCSAFSRRSWFVGLILVMFLPTIPFVWRPRPPDDVTADAVRSLLLSPTPRPTTPPCVVTATGSAHRGRVIGLKRMAGGRLGNDMFVYASLVGIAARNERVPIYKCDALNRTFQVTHTGHYVINPPTTNMVEESAFRYVTFSPVFGGLPEPSRACLVGVW